MRKKHGKMLSTHTLEKLPTEKRVPIEKFALKLRRKMTAPEKILFRALQVALEPYVQRAWPQHIIGPYIADFMISGAYVVVEVDGHSHDGEKAQQYDRSRATYMRNIGFTTLRFTNTEVMREIESVIAKILAACTLTTSGVDNGLIVKCPPGNARYSMPWREPVAGKRKTMKTALSSFATVKAVNYSGDGSSWMCSTFQDAVDAFNRGMTQAHG